MQGQSFIKTRQWTLLPHYRGPPPTAAEVAIPTVANFGPAGPFTAQYLRDVVAGEKYPQRLFQDLGDSGAPVPPHSLDALGVENRLHLVFRLVCVPDVALFGLQHTRLVDLMNDDDV